MNICKELTPDGDTVMSEEVEKAIVVNDDYYQIEGIHSNLKHCNSHTYG